jgi:hypothetical protein
MGQIAGVTLAAAQLRPAISTTRSLEMIKDL